MDIDKTLKRRMKIKRQGDDWSWINFKYERISTFCFVYGMLGHQERDCAIVYANPGKDIARAYGVWMRAPPKNEGSAAWEERDMETQKAATVHGSDGVGMRFMEVDGLVAENPGVTLGINVIPRNQENLLDNSNIGD